MTEVSRTEYHGIFYIEIIKTVSDTWS